MRANVRDEGKLSPMLNHLLPAIDAAEGGSATRTPPMFPPGADFYSACVSISPAPGPGLLPYPRGSSAFSHDKGHGSIGSGNAHESEQASQSSLQQLYTGRRWEGVDDAASSFPAYCISETSSSAPASMHGSIHARGNAWPSDRSRKGDSKLHGKGATDMRRCVKLGSLRRDFIDSRTCLGTRCNVVGVLPTVAGSSHDY